MSGPLLDAVPQRVVLATEDDPLRLRGGKSLEHVEVVYETYGELSPARDNVVFICHALTGDAHAAGYRRGEDPHTAKPGWWDRMIGPGKPVDTDRFFVVAPNILGGCSGTTGPMSIDPATGEPRYLNFPLLHVSDLVACHRRLLDHLQIETPYAAVGGSMGGMQVLQWVIEEPRRIERAVVVAASSRLSAENIAFSSVARQAIMADPEFHGGRYAERGVVPRHGQKVARMMAHITYVSPESLETRFDHRRDSSGDDQWRLEPDFEVEHYLQHQGETFLGRFDSLSYLYLTRLMDYFDPFADEPVVERLAGCPTRFQVTSFSSDWRFDTSQSVRLTEQLQRCGVNADHAEIHSPYGHDSFLLDPPGYLARVKTFLDPDAG